MGDVTKTYLKIITGFQGMFFQLNCKVLTTTPKKTKKQHNSTKTTTCTLSTLYLVVICMFLNWQIIYDRHSEC